MEMNIEKLNSIYKEEIKLIWITDIDQNYFYIKNGAKPQNVHLNANGLVAIAFNKEDTRKLYEIWKRNK